MYSPTSETNIPVDDTPELTANDVARGEACARPVMRRQLPNLTGFLSTPWHHRNLLWEMTRREILTRYRGSLLGLLWSFSQPVLLLAIYAVVFGIIFEAKWSADTMNGAPFALILFAGLIVYSFFAECVSRAPGLVLAYPSYVKKIVFPLDILVWVTVLSALFHAAVSLIVLILVQTVVRGFPGSMLAVLPLVITPAVLFTLGLTWFLAALGVFFRDVAHAVTLVTTVMLFLSPVFYPITALPASLWPLAWLNPLALVIEEVRRLIFFAAAPHWMLLLPAMIVASLVAVLGWLAFEKLRPGFADVV